MGGGWRQAGILASAGLVALDTMIDRLHKDHEHAYKIAKGTYDNFFYIVCNYIFVVFVVAFF